nr:putative receptor protein kinase ZmPK1 [Tanacetum cinerariifolium]
MAPEWVFNLPITSKVDVYSYGMVVLEMITGRSSTCDQPNDDNERVDQKMLILDPEIVRAENEEERMKNLLNVALQCVEEDRDARSTMSEVVKMLLNYETDD